MHTQRGAALHRAIQRARHQAVCVAAALIDVHAGVAALETRDRHAVAGHIRRALLLEFERAVKAHAARAGHGENALFLRVEVQKLFALQVRAVQRERAVHADLLVDGEDRLDGGMGERFVG